MLVSAFGILLCALLTTVDHTYAVDLPTVDPSTFPVTFQLFENSSSILPAPPEACGTALSSVIKCNQTLLYLQSRSTVSSRISLHTLNQADLSGICTTDCFTSLKTIAGSVGSTCSNQWTYDLNNGRQTVSYVPDMPFQWLEYTFNQTCLTDTSTKAFCALAVPATPGDTEVALPDLPTAQLCTNCMLNTLHNQMASPFGYDPRFEDDWLTIQQKCGVNLTVAVPSALTTTLHATSTSSAPSGPTLLPASNSTCLYNQYTVRAGDTVEGIAEAQGLSYYQLILINGLMFDGSVLPPVGSSMCLSGTCNTYVVKTNDTCVSVAKANGISWTQIKSWNTQLNVDCSNIDQQVGHTICLSPPGGAYQPPSLSITFNPAPTPTAVETPTGAVAPGSDRVHCGEWYTVQTGDDCPTLLARFGITNDTFYQLNPVTNADCSNLFVGFQYCVALFGNLSSSTSTFFSQTGVFSVLQTTFENSFPRATGFLIVDPSGTGPSPATTIPSATPTPTPTLNIASGTVNTTRCLEYFRIQSGDTCFTMEQLFKLSLTQILFWNTGINKDCSNLLVDTDYCIYGPNLPNSLSSSTPITTSVMLPPPITDSPGSTTTPPISPTPTAPLGPGTLTDVQGCDEYYTAVSGDTCTAIETSNAITHAQMLSWNTGLTSTCSNLQAGIAYCVAGPTPTTTTGPTGSPTAPIAPGTITQGCNKYYEPVSGDSCGAIETKFSVSLSDILRWNTGLNSGCTNLQLGLNYCVSGPSSTGTPVPTNVASGTITTGCLKYYTVVSGDNCFAISQTFNTTIAKIQTWNPELNSGCTNLLLGEAYCVSGP
ncbi:hypothetical protein BD779DRAFT_441450 [Infundibulicybe gibba]|nr:hypothetical protein BD779DRAFT_441450 [Infundibulicybe gibba]